MAKRAYQKKYHFIYKTTRFDGKYYIGIHSTDDLDDGYKGSGVHIGRSLRYHGKDKHVREILEFLPSRETLVKREADYVTRELLESDALCMNLDPGGRGGKVVDENLSESIRRKVKEAWKDPVKRANMEKGAKESWTPERCVIQSQLKKKQHENPEVLKNISEGTKAALSKPEAKKNMADAKAANWKDPEYRAKQIAKQNLGKQSESFKLKQSAAKSGANNPNFGSKWVYNELLRQSKRIPKHDAIPAGWKQGRKIYKE